MSGPSAISKEQLRYSGVLRLVTWTGLILLFVGFAGYLTTLRPPLVPIERLPDLWRLRAADYIAISGAPTAWGWVQCLRFSDVWVSFGFTLLAGASVVCSVSILPIFLRRGDVPYACISLLQILIMILAASGILTASGH